MRSTAYVMLTLSLVALVGCAPQQRTTQQGEPRFVISLDENSAGERIGGDCRPGARVDVTIEIGGGAALNSLRGTAYCDANQVARTGLLADPGTGQAARASATGQQVAGQAKCGKSVIWGNPRSRNITVVCYFY